MQPRGFYLVKLKYGVNGKGLHFSCRISYSVMYK